MAAISWQEKIQVQLQFAAFYVSCHSIDLKVAFKRLSNQSKLSRSFFGARKMQISGQGRDNDGKIQMQGENLAFLGTKNKSKRGFGFAL